MKPDDMSREIGGFKGKVPMPLVSCATLVSEQKFDDAASLLSEFKGIFELLGVETLHEFPSSKEHIKTKLNDYYNQVKSNYELEDSPYDKAYSLIDFVYYTLLGEFYWDYGHLLTSCNSLDSTKKQLVNAFIKAMFYAPTFLPSVPIGVGNSPNF
jgi:hypothetical protein